tara:strand:- start:198 stop:341 length:144 start_codon:yes stop_codon:yes gene_type:complete
MVEIVLKLFIILMFLSMDEIPYIIKMVGIAVIGTAFIIDWYTFQDEE